jgi:transcriptional regulator with XRE-family HTH domain
VADLLTEYCWSQRPPLTFADLAAFLGRPKTTIYSWINHYQIPSASALADIARRTGIPVESLFAAASAPGESPGESPGEDPAPAAPAPRGEPASEPASDPWEEYVARIEADDRFSVDAREAVIRRIRDVQAGYEPSRRHIVAEHTVESTPPMPRPAAPSRPDPSDGARRQGTGRR